MYFPLDEAHPIMPFEPYGLTKQVGEDIGRMIARNSDTTVVSLRFTNVALPEVPAEFPCSAPTPENPLTLVRWAYADARDVAEAHVLAVEPKSTSTRCSCSPNPSAASPSQLSTLSYRTSATG
jgi:nucleoside-diphosphate-sugar epimerase